MTPLEHATKLLDLGYRIAPIRRGSKYPYVKGWTDLSSDEVTDRLEEWWGDGKNGIGWVQGLQYDGSFIWTIDLDRHDPHADGVEGMRRLTHDLGVSLPNTTAADTGGNGRHLIFQGPADCRIRNFQSQPTRLAPGIDVRGAGGQIVVAPTVHPDTGALYEWRNGRAPWETPPAMAPDWLLDLVLDAQAEHLLGDAKAADEVMTTPGGSSSSAADTNIPTPHADTNLLDKITPADHLRNTWNWHDELIKDGWIPAGGGGTTDLLWKRPGKHTKGHSAVLHTNTDTFVVFSNHADMQQLHTLGRLNAGGNGTAVTPLQYVAATKHGGDIADAARAIRTTMPKPEPDDWFDRMEIDQSASVLSDTADEDDFVDRHIGVFLAHNAVVPDPDPLIADVLDYGTVGLLYARWGCYKSFMALDWGLHVAAGIDWYGHTVDQRPVLVLGYEAPYSLVRRAQAWGKHHERVALDNYWTHPKPPRLTDPAQMAIIGQVLDRLDIGLVIIDTIARGGPGSDMNNHEADLVYAGLHALSAPSRVVLGVTHAGKDASRGVRGYSAQEDQVDYIYRLDRERDQGTQQPIGPATLSAPKAKDREPLDRMRFDLVQTSALNDNERVMLALTEMTGTWNNDGDVAPSARAERKIMHRLLEQPGDGWFPTKTLIEVSKDGTNKPESRRIKREHVRGAIELLLEREWAEQDGERTMIRATREARIDAGQQV